MQIIALFGTPMTMKQTLVNSSQIYSSVLPVSCAVVMRHWKWDICSSFWVIIHYVEVLLNVKKTTLYGRFIHYLTKRVNCNFFVLFSYHRRVPCKLRDWASSFLSPVSEVLRAHLWNMFSQTHSCLSPHNTPEKMQNIRGVKWKLRNICHLLLFYVLFFCVVMESCSASVPFDASVWL